MPIPEQTKKDGKYFFPPSLESMTSDERWGVLTPLQKRDKLELWQERHVKARSTNKLTPVQARMSNLAVDTAENMAKKEYRNHMNGRSEKVMSVMEGDYMRYYNKETEEFDFPKNLTQHMDLLNHFHGEMAEGTFSPAEVRKMDGDIQSKKLAPKILDGIAMLQFGHKKYNVLDDLLLRQHKRMLIDREGPYAGPGFDDPIMYDKTMSHLNRQLGRSKEKSWLLQYEKQVMKNMNADIREPIYNKHSNEMDPSGPLRRNVIEYDKVTREVYRVGSSETTLKDVVSEDRKLVNKLVADMQKKRERSKWIAGELKKGPPKRRKIELIAEGNKIDADMIDISNTIAKKRKAAPAIDDQKRAIKNEWNVDSIGNDELEIIINTLREGSYPDNRLSKSIQTKYAGELEIIHAARPIDYEPPAELRTRPMIPHEEQSQQRYSSQKAEADRLKRERDGTTPPATASAGTLLGE